MSASDHADPARRLLKVSYYGSSNTICAFPSNHTAGRHLIDLEDGYLYNVQQVSGACPNTFYPSTDAQTLCMLVWVEDADGTSTGALRVSALAITMGAALGLLARPSGPGGSA